MTASRGHLLAELTYWKGVSRANAIVALSKDAEHYERAQRRCQTARAAAMKQSLLKSVMVIRAEVAPTMKVADVTSAMERIEKVVGESALAADAAYQSSGFDSLMNFTDQVVKARGVHRGLHTVLDARGWLPTETRDGITAYAHPEHDGHQIIGDGDAEWAHLDHGHPMVAGSTPRELAEYLDAEADEQNARADTGLGGDTD